MTTRSVWLEAALNGPWARALQPAMPITVGELVAEGIACAQAGAAIIHVHAYDERTGRQRDDAEIYRRIIEGIREEQDVIVYPTLPVMGGPDAPRAMTAPERFKAVEQLAMQGLVEWAVVDPGSVNFAHYDRLAANQEGFVYLNPEGHPLRPGARRALRLPPQLRDLRARLSAPGRRARPHLCKRAPANLSVHVSDGFAFGFPPEEYGLEAYLKLLEEGAPEAHWMIAGLAVDIRPLIRGRGRARRPRPGRPRGCAARHRYPQRHMGRPGRRGDRESRRPPRHGHGDPPDARPGGRLSDRARDRKSKGREFSPGPRRPAALDRLKVSAATALPLGVRLKLLLVVLRHLLELVFRRCAHQISFVLPQLQVVQWHCHVLVADPKKAAD